MDFIPLIGENAALDPWIMPEPMDQLDLPLLTEENYKKLYSHLKSILATHVKLEENETQRNKRILRNCLAELLKKMCKVDPLFDELFQRPYYTGSYYEGLRVKHANEFDLNLILKMPFKETRDFRIIKEDDIPSSFCVFKIMRPLEVILRSHKKVLKSRSFVELFDSDGYFAWFSADAVRSWLQSVVDKALPKMCTIEDVDRIIPSQHGPAKTLYIITNDGKQIDVDLVPVIEMRWPAWPEGARKEPTNYVSSDRKRWFLVPKPYKGCYDVNKDLLWRLHFPEIEKSMLHNLGCAKPLIKLLKLLRDCQGWHSLASYYLKTVVLWEVEARRNAYNWTEKDMAKQFIVCLRRLQKYLQDDHLPYLFYPDYSLIETISSPEKYKIVQRIERIFNVISTDVDRITEYFNNYKLVKHISMQADADEGGCCCALM